MHCAQSGIDLIGVKSPLISWKIMMKANMMKMLWSMVDERLAMVTPSHDMTRLNKIVAR